MNNRQKRHLTLYRNILTIQGRQTNLEMAIQIGLKSATTWRGRLSSPGRFTIDELTAISKRYCIPVESLLTQSII